MTLAPEQRQAVQTALSSPISILTGGPGTGKTQTLTMIIETIKVLDPSADIRLCAPTGKAAIRMRDLTGSDAETIHRMVGYPQKFLEEDELVCDFLIADEFSMQVIKKELRPGTIKILEARYRKGRGAATAAPPLISYSAADASCSTSARALR